MGELSQLMKMKEIMQGTKKKEEEEPI